MTFLKRKKKHLFINSISIDASLSLSKYIYVALYVILP